MTGDQTSRFMQLGHQEGARGSTPALCSLTGTRGRGVPGPTRASWPPLQGYLRDAPRAREGRLPLWARKPPAPLPRP